MKIFGTDGIRGTANQHPRTAECALKIGMAAGLHFGRTGHRILGDYSTTGDGLVSALQVLAAIAEGKRILGDDGRLIVRKSGTEPLIRIMAEGSDRLVIEKVINDVACAIRLAA